MQVYLMLQCQNIYCNYRIYQNLSHPHQGYAVKYVVYFQMKLLVLFYHTKYIVPFLCIS